MKQFALLLFLLIHLSQAYVKLEDCLIDNRSLLNAWEERLRDKIMCNYNSDLPPKPLNDTDFIVVKVRFLMKSFKFVSDEQEFSIATHTLISWRDERLKWDPSDYDGIDDTLLFSYKLWLPGIKLYNAISDTYDQSYDTFMLCQISSAGIVECVSILTFQTKCRTDMYDWPFDTHVCSLEFGPWAHQRIHVHLDFGRTAFLFDYSAEWSIVNYSQEENQDAVSQLKMYFTITRHSAVLTITVIYPAILLAVLTFSILFLDVRRTIRLYMSCFSLACHFYFLSDLGMNIPGYSKNTPRILFIFRGSFIMNFISIVVIYLLNFICERKVSVPNLISATNEYAYKSYSKFVIHPRWETASGEDSKSELVKAWIDFANILNSVWIFVSLIVYIIMCCVFIPSPNGLKQNITSIHYMFE